MDASTLDPSRAPYRYLALGDSYTIGEAVAMEARFPVQTVRMLASRSVFFNFPEFRAVTGWTTADLLSSLDARPPADDFDLVTLLIGVNNQYRQRPASVYEREFPQLLERAVRCAKGRPEQVMVLSIPDYSVTQFARNMDRERISREIDELNGINKEKSLGAGAAYLDVTTVSRKAEHHPGLIAGDGLHPSAEQYALWSALLFPAIGSWFQENRPVPE